MNNFNIDSLAINHEMSAMMKELSNMEIDYEKNVEPGMYLGCQDIQQKIMNDTELWKEIENLNPWLENWTGSFLHSVYHHLKHKKSYNSILFCALEAQTMQLDWVRFSICSGQYDMALRELRNVLESAFLFFQYDYNDKFKDLSVEEKYKSIKKEISLDSKCGYGQKVFKKSGFANWKNAYNNLYGPLSRFVHTGNNIERAMDIDKNGFNEIPSPYFDRKEIKDCIKFFKEVIYVEIELMETILKDIYEIDEEYKSIFK